MKAWRDRRSVRVLGVASAGLALLGTLVTMIVAGPAFATIGGTFVPVAMNGVCTLTTGFSDTGGDCGPGISGQHYIYLPTVGSSLTYSFTLSSGSSEVLTYGIPAGGYVNNVAASLSLDGGGPVVLNSDLGAFDATTPTDLSLWTSSSIGPGAHTLRITSTGDATNIYGLWISDVSTTVTTALSDGSQTAASISVPGGTSVTDQATLGGATATAGGTVAYTVFSDSACTTSVGSGGTVTVTGGAAPVSAPVVLTDAGTYYWQASYSGDGTNDASASACGSEIETVTPPSSVTVPCGTGTTSCSATVTAPTQDVAITGAKPSDTTASITVSVTTAVLSCPNFGTPAAVTTLTDTGLEPGSLVVVSDTVLNLPSKKGVLICYQPVGPSPPAPTFLAKCQGKKSSIACIKSVKEESGSVVAQLLVPAGDPRFHVGSLAPVVTSVSPTSPKPGKKFTVKGLNLSEVTAVTVGGVTARIIKTAPTKVSAIAPAGAQGVVHVTSLAGGATSAVVVSVS